MAASLPILQTEEFVSADLQVKLEGIEKKKSKRCCVMVNKVYNLSTVGAASPQAACYDCPI